MFPLSTALLSGNGRKVHRFLEEVGAQYHIFYSGDLLRLLGYSSPHKLAWYCFSNDCLRE